MKLPNQKVVCVLASLALVALLLSVPQSAGAMDYIFTKIADNRSGPLVDLGALSIIYGGTVVFEASLPNRFTLCVRDIFTGNGRPLITIADRPVGLGQVFFVV